MAASRFYSSVAGAMVLNGGITAVATSLGVDNTTGLPGSTPFTIIVDYGSSTTEEIMTVTAVAGLTLTVVRGQDGTAAVAHNNGAAIRHAITARDLQDSRNHEAATAAHGTTGAIVGASDAQTLTNKTISGASNTLSGIPSAAVTGLDSHTGSTAAHGATGAVVGTTNTQTLSGKTFDPLLVTGGSAFKARSVTQSNTDKKVAEVTTAAQDVTPLVVSNTNSSVPLVDVAQFVAPYGSAKIGPCGDLKVSIGNLLGVAGLTVTGGDATDIAQFKNNAGTTVASVDKYGNLTAANFPSGAWTSYTPTLTASTTNPGAGTVTWDYARYTQVGKTVHVAVKFTVASVASLGSGTWLVSLPVAGVGNYSYGSAMVNNGTYFTGLAMEYNTSNITAYLPSSPTNNAATGMSQAGLVGTAWAVGHNVRMSLTYEAA